MISTINTKYEIKGLPKFKKQFKKIIKQGKNVNKFIKVVTLLANGETLPAKYKDHALLDSKFYKGCRECHIEPDWLLIYKLYDNELMLCLVQTGSHSNLFV